MGKLEAWGNKEMGQLGFFPIENNPLAIEYTQLSTRFDQEHGVLWTEMNAEGIPCCTRELLDDLHHHHKTIENSGGKVQIGDQFHPVRYSVVSSLTPGVFNLGGDLGLFVRNSKTVQCSFQAPLLPIKYDRCIGLRQRLPAIDFFTMFISTKGMAKTA